MSAMEINEVFEDINGLTWFNVGLMLIALCAVFLVLWTYITNKVKAEKIKKDNILN
jgi:ABC-type phosphate transport system permease subunit